MKILYSNKITMLFLLAALLSVNAKSQTDLDGVMMRKNYLCSGVMYGYSSWQNYWEGTFKRDNQNLGTVSTQMIGVMSIYGIKNNLNVIANLPYVKTNATMGTLHGMRGMQDLSLWLKWRPLQKQWGRQKFSLFGLGGLSFPVSDYTADFLPVSIGLHSTTISARVIADYQVNHFFVTGSATYTYRSNIHIARNAYYTTEMHLTNEVEMPDVASFNFRTGYRSPYLIAEAVVSNMTTLGGFDIRKNDMPFASNRMNATMAGVSFKYTFKKASAISLTGDASYVIAGRNVGQATSFNAGVFYAISLAKKESK